MDLINSILGNVSDFMYTYILIIMLIAVGLYFSFRTKFVQFRLFPEALRVLSEKKKDGKDISSFQALMISTASRVGTGNIAGVATAVAASTAIGGYGAIFWMWLLALIGAASAFIESTLAQLYKHKNGDEFVGGPAYYIQKGLKSRKLGIVFSVLLIACFAYGFNALQSFNAGSALKYYIPNYDSSIWPFVVGAILALLTALTIFGGVHRISGLVSAVVPIMAFIYIGLGLYITFTNLDAVPDMFSKIFKQAFDYKAVFGGFAGSCVMQGIKRGLYSNEAGMGSAPNAAAAAEVSHPVKQGLVQMLSVFIDTFGPLFITISIFLFAFSSLVGNYYYTESNFKFIKESKKGLFVFRCTCIIAIFAGALLDFTTVWTIADILMGLMAIVNLIAIVLLGRKAIAALKDYQSQRRNGKDPVFIAENTNTGDPEVWNKEHAKKWEN